MLYNIHIPQKELIEAGFKGKLNANHWAVICVVRNMQASNECLKKIENKRVFVWTSYGKLQEELEFFDISKSRFKQIVTDLCNLGLLDRSEDNESSRKMFVATTDLTDSIMAGEPVKKLPDTSQKTNGLIGQKIDCYNNTNNNTITDNISLSLGELETKFEEFRKSYKGVKRGFETEFKLFQKHKDWKEVVSTLLETLQHQTQVRDQLGRAGKFVPQWPNLQTYINQRRWEEELSPIETARPNQIPAKPKQNVMKGSIIGASNG